MVTDNQKQGYQAGEIAITSLHDTEDQKDYQSEISHLKRQITTKTLTKLQKKKLAREKKEKEEADRQAQAFMSIFYKLYFISSRCNEAVKLIETASVSKHDRRIVSFQAQSDLTYFQKCCKCYAQREYL